MGSPTIPSRDQLLRLPYCLQCRREVPVTPAIAVEVIAGGELQGYLHRFQCQGKWQDTHPAGFVYGLPRARLQLT
jgi:hypothetical protein